jgi:actin-like ATPase involved in cell morphogenesis
LKLSSYTVGIDLGTTNSVVSYFNEDDESPRIELLKIRQNIEAGLVEEREVLPSFLYYPLESEIEANLTEKFPWQNNNWIAGIYARDRGVEVPGNFVSSAKSWLCQSNVNRKDPILPFQSEECPEKVSPFEVSTIYLRTIAGCWREQMGSELGDQNIILTIPASFDEEAKKLTEEAAHAAGFHNLTLLEEPQAALYAWVASRNDDWRNEVEKDDVILVCDIGGGTSDFSLIKVVSDDGNLSLQRTAVGEHILLGGDNMDLALAYNAKVKMETGKKLNASQLRALWYKARKVKEDILNGKSEKAQFTVLGSGLKKLIGGTMKAEFSPEEVQNILVDGFFPECSLEDMPAEQSKAGVQEIGLPYASDAAITKHLARFIVRQMENPDFSWPSKLLFNGGVFNCDQMRNRLLNVINSWLHSVDQQSLTALNHSSLDNAVAKGASYYGWARLGKGIRIRSGISRSYYIQVESAMPAIPGMPAPQKAFCIAPFGMEEGSHIQLEGKSFALTTGIPASFQFYSSTIRHEDGGGTILEDWNEDELEETSAMEVTLDSVPGLDNPIPVYLGTYVTETGTLEIFFKHTESERQWQLEYSVREDS